MPSEKLRYLLNKPKPPVTRDELEKHLVTLGSDRLVNILLTSVEYDTTMKKVLTGIVGVQFSNDFEKTKSIVDYLFNFPDYIPRQEGCHSQIFDEIKTSLEFLINQSQRDFALNIAKYVIEQAKKVAVHFEDTWEWESTLKEFEEWTSANF